MKKIRIFAALSLFALLFVGCSKTFLDLEPLDSQTEAIYFKTASDFEYGANYLHTLIYAWAGNDAYAINFDRGTDICGGGDSNMQGTLTVPTSDAYWDKAYSWLRSVNVFLEKCAAYENHSEIAGYEGQAYFFRAWHHFFLLKRYGGVPIADHATDTGSEDMTTWGPRSSRYEVIQFILNDLDAAIKDLANTTVASTGNDGHVTLEAAKALKARICLYEGTWEKYNGIGSADSTNGDGTSSGAGVAVPSGYPSVTDFLNMAKSLSKELIDSGTFEIWMGVEDVSSIASVKNPEMYAHHSYYYLFNLEGSESNPAGMSKSSNKEAIFRTVYDKTNKKGNMNLTHSAPGGMTRKLYDMYLCTDGLPVNISPLFGDYTTMNAERQNRDWRFLAVTTPVEGYWWGYGMYSTGAQYDVDITTLSKSSYMNIPSYRNADSGVGGRKFCSEMATYVDYDESMDCMHIRYPEILLIYAEATCELGNGSISDADLDYSINKVRARGGVAPLNAALIAKAKSLGCELTLLGEIRRERALELYAEGHRFYDLCRWGTAESELAKPVFGAYLSYNGVDSYIKSYINPIDGLPAYDESGYAGKINTEEVVYDYPGIPSTKPGAIITTIAANRKFTHKNYLLPIPSDQIKLNPNLTQNPEW